MKTISGTRKISSASRHILMSLLVSLLCVRIASGQVATGFPPFAPFSGGPDIVNLANGNVHIIIPVFSRSGRGMPFSYALQYDSSIWSPYDGGGYYGAWSSPIGMGWTPASISEVGGANFNNQV